MIDFPSSPTPGQPYTSGGMTWVWDGVKWNSANTGAGVYLPLSGGTMTGTLALAPPSGTPLININKPVGANYNLVQGLVAGSPRWSMFLGDATAEATGDVGSDFYINRFNNAGGYIDSPVSIKRSSGAVTIKGVSDGSNAAAGMVGEYISATSATVSLVNNAQAGIISISLTAGDWDACGAVSYAGTTIQIVNVQAGVGLSSTTLPPFPATAGLVGPAFQTGTTLTAPMTRISITATTTVYLVVYAGWTGGTATGTAFISARRMR